DGAGRRLLELEDQLGGGALAAAGFADDAQGAAGLDRERHAVDRAHHPRRALEEFAAQGEVLDEAVGVEQRAGTHRASGPASQQRAAWRGPRANAGGASTSQRAIACGQRGANAHPAGNCPRSGGTPSTAASRSTACPRRGMASSSARVYGCAGALKI